MVRLIILCGIPFSGKTRLTQQLTERLQAVHIDLDKVKFAVLGTEVKNDEIGQAVWDRVYQEMYGNIRAALMSGKVVIHDTGNFTRFERGVVRQIGMEAGVDVITVWVSVPVEVARERLEVNRLTTERFDISDVAFESAVAEMEPPTDDEPHIVWSEAIGLEALVAQLVIE